MFFTLTGASKLYGVYESKNNQEGNRHYETKTNIYQHSGSSFRVPFNGDVRSAGSERRLYRSDHDF
jgi:hypothetical protein